MSDNPSASATDVNETAAQGTCFVVMGFGKKTDFETGRVLDLDQSYKNLIKPAVEAAGLKCIRADEIVHSGLIDVPMYEPAAECGCRGGRSFYFEPERLLRAGCAACVTSVYHRGHRRRTDDEGAIPGCESHQHSVVSNISARTSVIAKCNVLPKS